MEERPEIPRLTPREKRLFLALHKYIMKWHEANPDVGMGPSPWMIIKEAEQEARINLNPLDFKEINTELIEGIRRSL